MTSSDRPTHRAFSCDSCHGEIQIPYDLPPTTGPCPHCQAELTSPPPPELEPEPGVAVVPEAGEAPGPAPGGGKPPRPKERSILDLFSSGVEGRRC